MGEGVLGGHEAGHAVVDSVFGADGIAVQGKAGSFDLSSELIGWCWAARSGGILLLGLFCVAGGWGRSCCSDFAWGGLRVGVVDGFLAALALC